MMPMRPFAALKTLGDDHQSRMLHLYQDPEDRGINCSMCEALLVLDLLVFDDMPTPEWEETERLMAAVTPLTSDSGNVHSE